MTQLLWVLRVSVALLAVAACGRYMWPRAAPATALRRALLLLVPASAALLAVGRIPGAGGAEGALLILPGIALGVGEAALAGLLGTVGVSALDRLQVSHANWLPLADGPALAPLRPRAGRLPWGMLAGTAVVTETVRAALVGAARAAHWGPAAAVVLGALAGLALMPPRSRRGTADAVAVALVVGVAHSWLMWSTDALPALVAAHLAFLLVTVA
ncbi:hypothetical protein ACFVRB_20140 [Streptomyces nojiriensis]|uniref:hypothetical protein n=1 Tax=Streptomyces nojiriensis TaxID=66374 RepID=UPI0036DF8DE4